VVSIKKRFEFLEKQLVKRSRRSQREGKTVTATGVGFSQRTKLLAEPPPHTHPVFWGNLVEVYLSRFQLGERAQQGPPQA
jgi:hypothetical protein